MANVFQLDNEKFERDSKLKGFITSVLIHAALLILLGFILTLEAPNPPIGSGEGVQVNFGTSDVGSGAIQPMNDNAQQAVTPPPPSADASTATPDKDQKIATQDVEDAPAINQSKETKTSKKHIKTPKKINTVVKTPTPTTATKVTNTPPAPPSPPAPTVDQRAMYKGAKGATNNSTGEGTDNMPGDKGMPNGDPTARGYTGSGGNGSGGSGGNGNGRGIGNGNGDMSYDLGGRSMLPLIVADNSQKQGVVVIAITVDRNGNVIEANYSVTGSTTDDDYLVNLALKAAYQAKFSNANVSEQRGSITFRFKFK